MHAGIASTPITPPDDQPPGAFNTAQFALAQVSNIGIMDVPTPAFPQGGFNDAQSALVQVGNSGIMDIPIPALQQYMHPEVIDDKISLQFVLGMGSACKYSCHFIQFLLIVRNLN